MPATPAWLAAVEAAVNRGIEASAQASDFAQRLDATCLRIDIEGVLSIAASVKGNRLALQRIAAIPMAGDPVANATVTSTPLALLQLMGAPRPARNPSNAARALIRGDAEIANLYRQLFAAARPDFEEELSRIIGDVTARRAARAANHIVAWARTLRRSAGENVAEYLEEEGRLLVNRTELDEFLAAVDRLREGADRLHARIARLEQQAKGTP